MRNLLIGIAALVLVAFAGFFYRNAVSRPVTSGIACSADARICPDGSAVGRIAPDCSFAVCPAPNLTIAPAGITFVLPAGYVADENALGADPTLLGAFVSPSAEAPTATIVINDYPITASSSASDIIHDTAIGDASGAPVSPSSFSAAHLGSYTYTYAVLGRFEGIVHVAYYLPRSGDVLRFEAVDRDVMNWTDSRLDLMTLPANAALRGMLTTIQTNQ